MHVCSSLQFHSSLRYYLVSFTIQVNSRASMYLYAFIFGWLTFLPLCKKKSIMYKINKELTMQLFFRELLLIFFFHMYNHHTCDSAFSYIIIFDFTSWRRGRWTGKGREKNGFFAKKYIFVPWLSDAKLLSLDDNSDVDEDFFMSKILFLNNKKILKCYETFRFFIWYNLKCKLIRILTGCPWDIALFSKSQISSHTL